MSIKPGPKPKKEDGTPDRRRRVTPESQPKHPDLKPHIHKKETVQLSVSANLAINEEKTYS